MGRPFLLLLLGFAACNDSEGKPAPRVPVNAERPEPVSPPTGISQIQANTTDIASDLAELEKAESPDPVAVERILKRIGTMMIVTERAIAAEAVEAVRRRHGLLMQKQAKLQKERVDVSAEIAEIQRILEEFDKTGKVPPGFTEAELRDRLADERERAAELTEEYEGLRAPLQECEDLLASGEPIPPQEDTLFTRERETLLGLRERAEALRQG